MRRGQAWVLVALCLTACGDDEGDPAGATGGGGSTQTSATTGSAATASGPGGSTTGQGAGGAASSTGTGGGGGEPLAADGAPCSAHDQCEGGVCLLEAVTGRPGGLCGSPCLPDAPPCDGTCVSVSPFGSVCHQDCAGDAAACRPAYACEETADGLGHCAPACREDADCPGTGYCDERDGRCVAAEASCEDLLDDNGDRRVDCADPSCAGDPACEVGVGAIGDPCTRHADCASASGTPLCLSEAATGYPGGACAQHCVHGFEDLSPAACASGYLCDSSLVFTEDAQGGSPVGHCALAACSVEQPCRAGYTCCTDAGCSYLRDTCLVGCTDTSECVDTTNECSSPQPGWPALCAPPEPTEICGNGVDDDENYDADCDDDACDAFCAGLAATLCSEAPALAATQSGATAPGPGIGAACLASDIHGEVSPQVYRYQAAVTGTLTLTLQSVRPHAVAVVAGCDLETSSPLACDKDAEFDGTVEVTAQVEAGAVYHVLVWPMAPGHEDTYTLTAELP